MFAFLFYPNHPSFFPRIEDFATDLLSTKEIYIRWLLQWCGAGAPRCAHCLSAANFTFSSLKNNKKKMDFKHRNSKLETKNLFEKDSNVYNVYIIHIYFHFGILFFFAENHDFVTRNMVLC